MKDLTFYGENLVFRAGGEIRVSFRTDLTSNTGNNFTVHQITGLEPLENSDDIIRKKLARDFKKLPYTLQAFKDFAEANYLELSIADSSGENSSVLIEGYGSDSVPGDESWFD